MNATEPERTAINDRQSYWKRRAKQERLLAASSANQRVHGIHLEMAIRYELLAQETSDRSPLPTSTNKSSC